jgi:hypothetical protein
MHRHELKLAGTVVAWMWELSEVDEVRQPARGAGGPGISVTTSLRIFVINKLNPTATAELSLDQLMPMHLP